jgi:DNA-binding Xre family transcriptional regulator
MKQSLYEKNQQILATLMSQAEIKNMKQLIKISGVSELQLIKLQNGLFLKLPLEVIIKISQALQVSLDDLISLFSPELVSEKFENLSLETIKKESEILQQKLLTQKQTLLDEFQQSSLDILESWLIQWPRAVFLAKNNPHFPVKSLLMLIKPIEKLLLQWGVKAIASINAEIPYNPQYHQLIEGTAQPGDLVKVRYIGYKKGEKLLHRVKVVPLKQELEQE